MGKAILTFEHVTGKGRKFHLEDICFELMPGYICGLIGENGAGKTTLIKSVMDDKYRYKGRILIEGEDIRSNHAQIKNRIGFVSEDQRFFDELSAKQNVEILGNFYDRFDMNLWMEMMKEMEVPSSKRYQKMSRGEKLKFQLAFAIAHQPCLYLIDEATAGMDPVFRKEFFEILQRLIVDEQASILMTSHIVSEIQRKTDYVGVMKEGKLVTFTESIDWGEKD